MTASAFEIAARRFEPGADDERVRFATPGDLARFVDPHTVQTPALDLIDRALVDAYNTPDARKIIVIPFQEGKTERVGRHGSTWVLHRSGGDKRIALCSFELKLARRTGRRVRDDIRMHGRTLGLRIRRDLSAQGEWQIVGRQGGVYSVGLRGGLTGRPVDWLGIDDVISNREQADSQLHRDHVWEWWLEVAIPRLAPGAPVVVVNTRWHDDDFVGRLLAAPDGHTWDVLHIPAQADHDPAKGETDVLGRAPGEFMLSARGRSTAQWQARKVAVGTRAWLAGYQGRPSPPEGNMYKRSWWREYTQPRWTTDEHGRYWALGPDEVCQSWDMAFKDLETSSYVVGQVWGRWGLDVFLLDQVRDHLSFVESRKAVRRLSAKWPQALRKYIEDKANGPAVIDSLRKTVPGLIAVPVPNESKLARASATSPFVEAGSVWLPSETLAPWVGDFVNEHASFPTGAHDDQVDAQTQALNRMLLAPIQDGSLVVAAEEIDEEIPQRISLY